MDAGPARIVLDTNAVLDWLLFGGVAARLKGALASGRLLPVVNAESLAEFDSVLLYPKLKVPRARAAELSAQYRAHAEIFIAPLSGEPADAVARLPQCRDPDDQKFLALAVAARAEFLVSRDREVLRLARRMGREWGITLLTPAAIAVHPRLGGPVRRPALSL